MKKQKYTFLCEFKFCEEIETNGGTYVTIELKEDDVRNIRSAFERLDLFLSNSGLQLRCKPKLSEVTYEQ